MVLPGFNTDFKYKGQVYHAQTEDNGVDNPVIVTLLYLRGAILGSKKTSYKDILGSDGFDGTLMDLMKAQHRDIMKAVLAGAYETGEPPLQSSATAPEEKVPPATATVAAPPPKVAASKEPKSLDQAILEFLSAFESGRSEEA